VIVASLSLPPHGVKVRRDQSQRPPGVPESLELRDLTAGKSLFLSKARASSGKIGIDQVDYYSSPEGIPLYKDHEYELVSVYNNTSGEDQDSMAVFYMYLLDKEYKRPQL